MKTVGPPYSGKLNVRWDGKGMDEVAMPELLRHCWGNPQITDRFWAIETLLGNPQITGRLSLSLPNHSFTLDMVIILKPNDDATKILDLISQFLAERRMNVSAKKTKLTATTDGFDFLGWHFKVQSNGKFRSFPSGYNFKALRQKVKHIVNNSNYGAKVKAEKLAPIVRGWRNYHRYCKMDGAKFSLWHINNRAFRGVRL